MKKSMFLVIAGTLFLSSAAMAQMGGYHNNCDGSCYNNNNMTEEQYNQMLEQRAQYRENNRNMRMNQANSNGRYNNQPIMNNRGNYHNNV